MEALRGKMVKPKEKLIVALDVNNEKEAQNLISELYDVVGYFKVGMQLYYSAGPQIIDYIHRLGGRVFLDLKLLDIPNTVAQASKALTRHGAAIIDLHASGGKEMMIRAVDAVHSEAERLGITPPLIVGVTLLTSISKEVLNREIGIDGSPEETVLRWARACHESGLDGVVASGMEARAVRENIDFSVIITPGIRPIGDAGGDDQKRILTPKQAIMQGATHLVVGRPITKAESSREAAEKILEEINVITRS